MFGLPLVEYRKPTMKQAKELVVITKTYDLILWSCNHTSRFPRQRRSHWFRLACLRWQQA